MNSHHFDKETMKDFVDFVEADPVSPKPSTDHAIHKMVEKDLNPSAWAVFGKLSVIEAVSGLATLLVCPQFDMGFGSHHDLLHSLHTSLPPVVSFTVCGIFFVLFGAVFSGFVLSRDEMREIRTTRYIYFVLYSLMAFMVFVSLGAEVFLLNAVAWIVGAAAGNVIGFEGGARIKMIV